MKKKIKIRFLEYMFGNDEGDVVDIIQETKDGLYYEDSFERYCFINKSEEGKFFEYVTRKKS